MRKMIAMTTFCAMVVGLVVMATTAVADPYPDQFPKFSQQPMIKLELQDESGVQPRPYYGHDEFSTAYLQPTIPERVYQGTFMADDFADTFDTPVVHLKWWGSYMAPIGADQQGVRDFLICFEKDVPANQPGPDGVVTEFSRPGEVLSTQVVKRGPASPVIPLPGTFTEKRIREPDPLLGEALYEYNAELAVPFREHPDEIYWLKIVALVDPSDPAQEGIEWGWHNRDYTIHNPLASPAVVPGEHNQGPLPGVTTPDGVQVPVWHFQDDAVEGPVTVTLGPAGTPQDEIVVDQPYEPDVYRPTYYQPPFDGPEAIGRYSKDLAFEIYSVPEPSTVLLLLAGVGCLLACRWSGRG